MERRYLFAAFAVAAYGFVPTCLLAQGAEVAASVIGGAAAADGEHVVLGASARGYFGRHFFVEAEYLDVRELCNDHHGLVFHAGLSSGPGKVRPYAAVGYGPSLHGVFDKTGVAFVVFGVQLESDKSHFFVAPEARIGRFDDDRLFENSYEQFALRFGRSFRIRSRSSLQERPAFPDGPTEVANPVDTRRSAGAPTGTSVSLAALLSFQPASSTNYGPYLDEGIGGTKPGFSLALEHHTASRVVLALELSRTARMEVFQSGRYVSPEAGGRCSPFYGSGCGPVLTRHSDTLVSALAGFGGVIEAKAGVSLILGTPKQGQFVQDDAAGRLALTVGVDGVIPIGAQVTLVPSARYSHALRGEDAEYVGLGSSILRIGLGVRIRLARGEARPADATLGATVRK